MKEINKRLKNIELWLDNMSDKNRETYSLLIKEDLKVIKKQLNLRDVNNRRELLLFKRWLSENGSSAYLYTDEFVVNTYLKK
jgi:hypothetical protein